MAMTLLEAAKRASGEVKRSAIISMFASNSEILRALPFENIQGDSYAYTVDSKLPNIGFRGVNEGYSEGVGIMNPEVERLRIVGGDLDCDKMLVKTRGGDIRATEEARKIQALSLFVGDRIINGDSVADGREFDGFRKRVGGNQLFPANLGAPSANSALSLEALDAAIDQVDGANILIMNKAMKRKLSKAAKVRDIGGDIETTVDDFGYRITMYNDLPILTMDHNHLGKRTIDFDEAGPAGGSTSSSIYVARFGDGYITGLQSGEMTVEDLGEVNDKPVYRTRLDWYVGLAVMHGRALARVWGINNADVTA